MSQQITARWQSLIIFGVILVVWMVQTKTIHVSWSESSRLAAIESLVERATWRIDASPYSFDMGDKVLLDGHYYSDKPPVFAAIGAVFYAMFHYGFGVTFAIDGCLPNTFCVYYWLTVLMVGLPSAMMAAIFYRLALRRVNTVGWAVGLTALLCFGTIVWPYSLVFNHHIPAAACLFIAFYWLFERKPGRTQLFGAGVLAGLAITFDLMSIFLALAFFMMVVIYHRRQAGYFIGGGLIPGIATIIFNYQITQTILFPYFSGQGYDFPGSQFDPTVAGLRQPDNILIYTFRNFIGDHGLLAYCPLLLFALAGLVQTLKPLWPLSIKKYFSETSAMQAPLKTFLVVLAIAGHLLFILTQVDDFGSDAYGGRYFILFIPILYAFITVIIPGCFKQAAGKWLLALWLLAAGVSIFSAYQGVGATWHQSNPPVYMALLSDVPYLTLETNLGLTTPSASERTPQRRARNFEAPPISHPINANFNNELVLLGYNLPARRVEPGQQLDLILYWQLLRVVKEDYFIFSHLLDSNQMVLSRFDRRLQEGYPVAFWHPGEIVEDRRRIPIMPETPNGLAWVRIGGYAQTDGKTKSLPLVIADHEGQETSLTIGPLLIGTSDQVINREHFGPQTALAVRWGEPPIILLRGYDLAQVEGQLQLILYWESLAPTTVDWNTFVQVRDGVGQIVAQKDGPTGNGNYPTSLWRTGEIVAEQIVIPMENLSNPDHNLYVGLYNLETGARLAVPDNPNNEILLVKDIFVAHE